MKDLLLLVTILIVGITLPCCIVMIFMGFSIGMVVLVGTVPMLIVLGLTLLYEDFFTLITKQKLASFQDGNYLVHWQYNLPEWQRFTENEAHKMLRKAFQYFPMFIGFTAVLGIFWLVIGGSKKPSDTTTLLGLIVGMPYIGLLVSVINYVYYQQLVIRRRKKIDEVYFDGVGLFQDGSYRTLPNITSVKLEPSSPAVIQFNCMGESSNQSFEVRIAVPEVKAMEAQKIIEIYGAKPKANRAALVAEYYNSRIVSEVVPTEPEKLNLDRTTNSESPYRLPRQD